MFGCMFGTFWEMFNHFIHHGNFVSRSALIYGPFNPVYGIGALLFLVLVRVKKTWKIFVYGMLLGGFCEYICSYVQEKVFGTISWNYSNDFLNIDGRTSLFYMVFWGLLALLFTKFIYPKLVKIINSFTFKHSEIITVCVLIFMVFNCFISVCACIRQADRVNGYAAKNGFEIFLDEHYPDERIDRIYNNKVRKK